MFKFIRQSEHSFPSLKFNSVVKDVSVEAEFYCQWKQVLNWRKVGWAEFSLLVADYSTFCDARQMEIGILGVRLLLTLESERYRRKPVLLKLDPKKFQFYFGREIPVGRKLYIPEAWVDLLGPVVRFASFRDYYVSLMKFELSNDRYGEDALEVFLHLPFLGVTFSVVPNYLLEPREG